IPQKAIVDENTCLPRTDRFVNQRRRDGRIDTARKSAHDVAAVADRFAYAFDLFFYELRGRPIARTAAYVKKKISQNFFAKRRVRNLRVKLNTIDISLFGFHRRDDIAGRRG